MKGSVAAVSVDSIENLDACDVESQSGVPRSFEQYRQIAERFPAISLGLLSLTDQVIVSATSFLTMVIIGRATTATDLGLYYLVVSILYIAVSIEEQVIAAPYTVYSKRYLGRDLLAYSGSAWVHHVALTGLAMAALLLGIVGLKLTGAERIVPCLWAMLAAGPFLLLRDWARRFSYANLRVASAVVLDLTVAIVQLGGLMLLWHVDRLSIVTVFGLMGAACAVASLTWYAFDQPSASFEPGRYLPDWSQNWSFGHWALTSYIVGNTTPYLMPWILGLVISTAATGVLGACVTLINVLNLFLISIDRILTPRAAQAFANHGSQELRRVLVFASFVLLPILGAFCLLIFAFGSQLAVIVYGQQYAGYGATLSALAIVIFMNGVGMIVGNGLWAIDQPRSNFAADVATLVVTLVAAAVLIFPLGVLGAALAMLAGASIGCLVRVAILHRALASLQFATEPLATRQSLA